MQSSWYPLLVVDRGMPLAEVMRIRAACDAPQPSETEIYRRAAEIRAAWSADELAKRAGVEVQPWTVPRSELVIEEV